jgi:hypothetical protein
VQHREHRTSALPPAMHTLHDHHKHAQQAPGKDSARCRDQRRQGWKNPIREPPRSRRRGGDHRIQLEEGVEGIEATILPKVAAAEIAGGGRNRRATARAIRVRERARERERVGAVLTVWVGLTDPAGRLGFWPARVGWAETNGLWPKA